MTYRPEVGLVHYGSGDPNSFGIVQGLSSSGLTVSSATNVTVGNIILVLLQTEDLIASVGAITVTDNLGNIYTMVSSSTNNSSAVNGVAFITTITTGGLLTITGNQVNNYARTSFAEFKGVTGTVLASGAINSSYTLSLSVSSQPSFFIGLAGIYHSGDSFTAGTATPSVGTVNNLFAGVTGTGSDATFIEYGGITGTGTIAFTFADADGPANSIFIGALLQTNPNAVSVGNDGDFYIDPTSKKIWGPRTAGSYLVVGTLN